MVSTCVILSGMTNIVCLLYVGWITNYVANSGPKVAESGGGGGGEAERKLEEDSKGETLRIIERLDRLESVVNEHIKGESSARFAGKVCRSRSRSGEKLRRAVKQRLVHKIGPAAPSGGGSPRTCR